ADEFVLQELLHDGKDGPAERLEFGARRDALAFVPGRDELREQLLDLLVELLLLLLAGRRILRGQKEREGGDQEKSDAHRFRIILPFASRACPNEAKCSAADGMPRRRNNLRTNGLGRSRD